MIVNELKPLLGDNWKEKFVHRDLWDPDGYGVASFDLGGEREKVLAINFETEDIMEYFYDDLPDDEWISLDKRIISLITHNSVSKFSYQYYIRKDYCLKGIHGMVRALPAFSHARQNYPTTSIYSSKNLVKVHRLIATVFVPNSCPERFDIVNHIDKNKNNFNKENLEWCDAEWNSKRSNQKEHEINIRYIRENDGKSFTREELEKEYSCRGIISSIHASIKRSGTCKGSSWKVINLTEEDYLSRHPLQDDWYQHPTMPNIRANGCGILEIDGKLRIGSRCLGKYIVSINNRQYCSHRIILECFLRRELNDGEVVDHITPVTEEDINNCKENLRPTTPSGNMLNEMTVKKHEKETRVYDLFGNLIDVLNSRTELSNKYGMSKQSQFSNILVNLDKYIIDDLNKLNYIYYKWEVKDEVKRCVAASSSLCSLYRSSLPSCVNWLRNRYLNTGMPAPDGFYYQQGDPWHMLYDPENKDLIKKREEVRWYKRDKEEN